MPPFLFSESDGRPTEPPDEQRWLSCTYLDYLGGLKVEAFEWSLTHVQTCRFAWTLQPPGWELFEGRVAALGVDRLGLTPAEVRALLYAIAGKGARVPATSLILRVARPWCALFEQAAGDEPLLPEHWVEGLELHGEPASLWIGKRVPEHPICPAPSDATSQIVHGARNRFADVDWIAYEPTNYGWRLRDSSALPRFFIGEFGN